MLDGGNPNPPGRLEGPGPQPRQAALGVTARRADGHFLNSPCFHPRPVPIMAPYNDIEAFHEVLRSSRRILALCGAGLSASSGLPTFRGAGGYWRNHDATRLATMQAFRTDPGFVWLFYGYRRHVCLKAEPNAAHRALAQLAQKHPNFLCLTQNVDGK